MPHDDPSDPHHHHGAKHHQHDALLAAQPRPAPAPPRPRVAPAPLPQGAGRGKTLHLDCFAGLAGDMLVGALLDLGVPLSAVEASLRALPLAGYEVRVEGAESHAIAASRFVVDVRDEQPYRTWRDIRAMLLAAPLEDPVRARALATFEALAVAEGRVHRIEPERVHFHEVGAVDAIVDIVAASAALHWLGASVSCAPLPMGHGFIKAEHGMLPLPAPAVVELCAGLPTVQANIAAELVTPTGAALVRANATSFARWPSLRPVGTGFGAGTRVLPDRPNLLRVVLGDPEAAPAGVPAEATHVLLESNLDDLSGELLARACEALEEAGALDVWTTPIGMKKRRPGVLLSALVRAENAEALARVLLAESGSLGVRMRPVRRLERPRESRAVQTPYGSIEVKVSRGDGLPATAKPEHSSVVEAARRHKVPARAVQHAALAALWSEELASSEGPEEG